MLRGCQKRIVFLKNTGSKIFDEAYFVISDKESAYAPPDLIAEANRIIEENVLSEEKAERGSRVKKIFKNRIVVFSLGALFSGISAMIIVLLIK